MISKLYDFLKYSSICGEKIIETNNYYIMTSSVILGISGLYIGIHNYIKFLKLKKNIEKDNKIQNNNTKLVKKIMDEKIDYIYNDLLNILKNEKPQSIMSSEYEDIDLNK